MAQAGPQRPLFHRTRGSLGFLRRIKAGEDVVKEGLHLLGTFLDNLLVRNIRLVLFTLPGHDGKLRVQSPELLNGLWILWSER